MRQGRGRGGRSRRGREGRRWCWRVGCDSSHRRGVRRRSLRTRWRTLSLLLQRTLQLLLRHNIGRRLLEHLLESFGSLRWTTQPQEGQSLTLNYQEARGVELHRILCIS